MPLIGFDSIDGSGKFTQLHRLMDALHAAQPDQPHVAWSSEPNDQSSPLGKLIRSILEKEQSPTEEFRSQRLFILDRAQDIFCFIRPVIDKGQIYLIERYAYSTIAYGMLSGLPADHFIKLHYEIVGPKMLWPDLTIILDLPVNLALERIQERAQKLGIKADQFFEKKDMLERVRTNYLELSQRSDIGASVVVDASGTPEEVHQQVLAAMKKFQLFPGA